MSMNPPNLECRMYESRYPEVDMAVMIQVKTIADMGAYVSLLEYNNIEGMILFSELSRRRIRSVSSLIKVGRQEPVMVLRVDKEKGYIDLSKRRVSEEEIQGCEERYNKSKLVHSIMRHVAETMEIDLEVGFGFSLSLSLVNLVLFTVFYFWVLLFLGNWESFLLIFFRIFMSDCNLKDLESFFHPTDALNVSFFKHYNFLSCFEIPLICNY